MKKCYIVYENGGEWEFSWQRPLRVFTDKTKAEDYREALIRNQLPIDECRKRYQELIDEAISKASVDELETSWSDLIEKYCEISEEELRNLEDRIENPNTGYYIDECELCL